MQDDLTRMPLYLSLKNGRIQWIEFSGPVVENLSAALLTRKQYGFEATSSLFEARLLEDSCGSLVLRLLPVSD